MKGYIVKIRRQDIPIGESNSMKAYPLKTEYCIVGNKITHKNISHPHIITPNNFIEFIDKKGSTVISYPSYIYSMNKLNGSSYIPIVKHIHEIKDQLSHIRVYYFNSNFVADDKHLMFRSETRKIINIYYDENKKEYKCDLEAPIPDKILYIPLIDKIVMDTVFGRAYVKEIKYVSRQDNELWLDKTWGNISQ